MTLLELIISLVLLAGGCLAMSHAYHQVQMQQWYLAKDWERLQQMQSRLESYPNLLPVDMTGLIWQEEVISMGCVRVKVSEPRYQLTLVRLWCHSSQ